MIRLIQRRLIIPRGDTGTFTVPVIATKNTGDVAVFSIIDNMTAKKVFEKIVQVSGDTMTIEFSHNETVNLPVGKYVWDIKFYQNPEFADGVLVNGIEVDSYYAAFTMPVCEIRQTGDNLLMADDAPGTELSASQLDILNATVNETNAAKNTAVESASTASAAASTATENAATAVASAEEATAALNELKEILPSLAEVATSGSYEDLEDKPFIPSRVSDLTDDSGHYTKPANGIPASDLEETYLTQHQDLSNYVQKTDYATANEAGVVRVSGSGNGISIDQFGAIKIYPAQSNIVKTADNTNASKYQPITPSKQHESTFYGLAKAAGDTTQSQSNNAVGTYTDSAKTAIQQMLGVPSTAAIPTAVSQLQNDSGYLTSFTETDPTVPAWAKASTKPTYTAAEVGAPTVQEMTSAISTAIGNVNSFDMAVVQELPTQDISTHTIYLVPKTGETNDVYDEYIYINNNWEMVGNTQVDLSNYVQQPAVDDINNTINDMEYINKIYTRDIIGSSNLMTNKTWKYNTKFNNDGTIASSAVGWMVSNEYIETSGNSYKVIYDNGEPGYIVQVACYKNEEFQRFYMNALTNTGFQTFNIDTTNYDKIKFGTRKNNPIIYMFRNDSTIVGALAGKANIEDIPNVPVQDVQVNGVSVLDNGTADVDLSNYVQKTDYATNSKAGIIKVGSGLYSQGNAIHINAAPERVIKMGTVDTAPIVTSNQHVSTFYGLAKAAGDTTQSQSANAVGTYTDEAKAAIQNMLDVPSTIDLSTKIDKESFNNAGIFNKTFTVIDNGEFTVVTETNSREESSKDITTNNINLNNYKHYKVTFDNIEYELYSQIIVAEQKWNEPYFISLGNHFLMANVNKNLVTKYQYTVPFCILDSGSQQLIFTQTAGAHTVKIEIENRQINLIPRELLHNGMDEYYQDGAMGARFSIGFNSFSDAASNSIGIGIVNSITAQNGVAIGTRNIVSGGNGTAVGGWKNTASGTYSFVSGMMNEAQGGSSVALGQLNVASGRASIALGQDSIANHRSQLVFGQCNVADSSEATAANLGNYVEIIGNGTSANARSNAYALDWDGNGHYMGDVYVHANADSTGGTKLATIEDIPDAPVQDVQVNGVSILADGVANVPMAIVSGEQIGSAKIADFYMNGKTWTQTASAPGAVALGFNVAATSNGAFAEGAQTTASGTASHAEGMITKALGDGAHAEGRNNTASAPRAHAEGQDTEASAYQAHSEGFDTLASGINSHAEGSGTIANSYSLHAGGAYNVENSYALWPEWASGTEYTIGDKVKVTVEENGETVSQGYVCKVANNDSIFTASKWTIDYYMDFAEIIGNGTDDVNRSNAYALDWNGNGHYAGDVYVHANADSTGGTKLVSETDYATSTNAGVVRVNQLFGLNVNQAGFIALAPASDNDIRYWTTNTRTITPATQHAAVFYGLARAAGDLTQPPSENAVGTYTTEAKSAIRTMLGAASDNIITISDTEPTDPDTKIWIPETATSVQVPTVSEMETALAGKVGDVQVNGTSIVSGGIATVPITGPNVLGVMKPGVGMSVSTQTGEVAVSTATNDVIKTGTDRYYYVDARRAYAAAFFGLAKAAGADMKDIANTTVGVYPAAQQTAIKQMLGVEEGLKVVRLI